LEAVQHRGDMVDVSTRGAPRFKLVQMEGRKIKAVFVEPMLLLRTERLPDGEGWLYEIFLLI
jgi:hypothetical protein